MRLLRWRRRPGAKSSRKPRRNALHLKIRATTQSAITGLICAAADEPSWPCQWCHGAPGIGLARLATAKQGGMDAKPVDAKLLATDIRNALAGVERAWPGHVDTLCCGTLGSIEFFCEAGGALERGDLRDLAARRLMAVLETRGRDRRLPLEQRKAAIQFGLVSRPCRRRLYAAAASRWLTSQHHDLGIAQAANSQAYRGIRSLLRLRCRA